MSLQAIKKDIRMLADPEIAEHSQRFFKTGPGEYAEGDLFVGIRVPVLRKLARQNRDLSQTQTLKLLKSKVHEERLLALLILVLHYEQGDTATRQQIYRKYVQHTEYINNWDLVDSSAHQIVGAHLSERSRKPLHKLAKSQSLWERRIAIIATYHFIKQNDFAETLELSKQLLHDSHDLIHKAVGWMLREVGNRDLQTEEAFLKPHYQEMPRTMLRYAIERFPENKRKRYLAGKI